MAVSWVLKPQHRSRVMFQRFMPWWNAQRRKEIAEKKEAEQRKKEEEKRQQEEKVLKEQQEKEQMELHTQPDETIQQEVKDKDNGFVGNDAQDKSVPEPDKHIEKDIKDPKSIAKEYIQNKVTKKESKKGTTQVKGVKQVGVQIKLNQDVQNGKTGLDINVSNQVAIKTVANKKIEVKKKIDDINKKNNHNEICIKIDKLSNFENTNIMKAHTENKNKTAVISVKE